MRRNDPPPVATWILEHLSPAGRNDALAGDLLEDQARAIIAVVLAASAGCGCSGMGK